MQTVSRDLGSRPVDVHDTLLDAAKRLGELGGVVEIEVSISMNN